MVRAVASGSEEVLEKIEQQVRILTRKGVKLVVATGRTLTKARTVLRQLSMEENSPIVLFNGAVVTNIRGVDISVQYLRSDTVETLIDFALDRKKVLLLYRFVPRALLSGKPSEEVIGIGPPDKRFSTDFNGFNVVWIDGTRSNVGKFNTALIHEVPLMPTLTTLKGADATTSGGGYVEVRPRGVDKGCVLSQIAERYQIDRKHVLAIGDNDNDCEMLNWAGLSVVPSNASKRAKDVASIISPFYEHKCVIEAFRLILDARRFSIGLRGTD